MGGRMLLRRAVLVGLVGFLAGAGSAGGQTVVFVDAAATGAGDGSSWADAFTAVQPGLNAAQSGEQVWVAARTYVGTITLKLDVALYGGFAGDEDPATFDLADRDFAANETILDGNQAGSVVTSPAGATATTRIDGFTITNGNGTLSGSYRYGGGIYCNSSSPTIANNRITGNSAINSGGGLFLFESSSTITDNTITGNSAYFGGAIACGAGAPMIANNAITGNTGRRGGGVYCGNVSSATIANNMIMSNSAYYGGGIACEAGAPMITNNTINRNTAWVNSQGCGGGIYCSNASSPAIASNRITNNSASGSGSGLGGGIYCEDSSPTIVSNSIDGNTVSGPTSSAGGGICCRHSSLTIANNAISGNTASGSMSCYGGGISCAGSSATIVNNTIMGNSSAWSGGGIYCYSSVSTVANNIVAYNFRGIYSEGETPVLRCNCVYGNVGPDYAGVTDPTGTDGNIRQDPLLADVAHGNGHIQPGSPCMDAGDSSHVQVGWVDLDGQPRQLGGGVDIGADESDGTVWTPGPGVIVRVSPSGDDENDGSSWVLAKRTVQAGIEAAALRNGDVWVAAGVYSERIVLRTYAHVYGGFSGTETSQQERDWVANLTILDGQQGGSVVTASVVAPLVSTVDGCTIRNGSGTEQFGHLCGGGVFCDSSAPTITNNTITSNAAAQGGGIYCVASGSMIANNTISDNTANSGAGIYSEGGVCRIMNNVIRANTAAGAAQTYGGGISCFWSYPTIANNTISGNAASGSEFGYGGGIHCDDYSGPTITGNCIAENSATSGGGIYCDYYSTPLIADNAIMGNISSSFGGGVHCDLLSTPTIANNTIAGNTSSSSGGGIYCSSYYTPTIRNNAITDNHAGSGGGIFCYHSDPMIANNSIAGNSSNSYGGGISCLGGMPKIANNAITGNCAPSALSGRGGGIYCQSSSPTVANSTISGNNAGFAGGGFYCSSSSPRIINTIIAFNSSGVCRSAGTLTLRYNCVYGNTAYNYSGVSSPTGAYGNISADPLFVQVPDAGPDGVWGTADDDYGDVRLLAGSPCIDAGSNGAVPADTLDLDGDGDLAEPLPFDLAGRPRFIDDPFTDDTGSGTAPIVDMGAYEYQVPGDLDGDSDVDGSDYALLLAAFGSCSGGARYQPAADADEDGCVTLVDYHHWLQGYRDFVGDPLAPPPPLPDWEPDPDPRPVPRPPPRPSADNGGVIGEGELAPVSPTD